MGIEIERKFLVQTENLPPLRSGEYLRQGYLLAAREKSIRIRFASEGKAWLTIKGPDQGGVRSEFEYTIPTQDAEEMWSLCGTETLEKTRYRFRHENHVWEIDEFHGRLRGLWVAEVELKHREEFFARPTWLGQEVTGDHRYTNAYLARHVTQFPF